MSKQTPMVYVAADPNQPGAAWAAIVDIPDMKREVAKSIGKWIKEGADVQRVTVEQAREMLTKWVRPEKKAKAVAQQPRLFS